MRRRDKTFPLTSQQLEREIGAELQALTDLPVRLRDPDLEVRVEIDREYAYVRTRELNCAGGLPVGVSGRAAVLLSGGIDSPVAALLAMKRGLSVEFVHFSGEPYLDPTATMKAQAQAKVLNGFQPSRPGALWVVPFGNQQRMISAVSEESHRIVLYRRQMARVACALAGRLGAAALVTGDSLGQVSSQTLPNMTSVEEACGAAGPAPAADLGQARGDGARRGARDPVPFGAAGRGCVPAVRRRQAADRGAAIGAARRRGAAGSRGDGGGGRAGARRVAAGVFLGALEPDARAG